MSFQKGMNSKGQMLNTVPGASSGSPDFHPWKTDSWTLQWLPSHRLRAPPAAPGACLWGGSVAGSSAHCSGQLPSARLLNSSGGPELSLRSPNKELIHCWWHLHRSQPESPDLNKIRNVKTYQFFTQWDPRFWNYGSKTTHTYTRTYTNSHISTSTLITFIFTFTVSFIWAITLRKCQIPTFIQHNWKCLRKIVS